MTIHEMRLHLSPFEKIRNGTKTIEMRLNDEKRQIIQIGDQIKFSSREDPEQTVVTEVAGLDTFPSFKEAYAAYPPPEYGAETGNEWENMYKYYSKDEEGEHGVLAIRVKFTN